MKLVQLYDEWSNDLTHYRNSTLLPDEFKIDLRYFMMPTDSRTVTSNYGLRWGRQHAGLDIKVYIGDTIRDAFDGKVRIVKYNKNGYRKFVVNRHTNEHKGLPISLSFSFQYKIKEPQQMRLLNVIQILTII